MNLSDARRLCVCGHLESSHDHWECCAGGCDHCSGYDPNIVLDVVFDGPPSHESPRFVEVEDENGRSVHVEWVDRGDGYWALRLPVRSWVIPMAEWRNNR